LISPAWKAPALRLSRSPNQPCGVSGQRSNWKRKSGALPERFCASIQAQALWTMTLSPPSVAADAAACAPPG